MINRLKVKLTSAVRKFLSLRASPHQIAMGFAIGAFIGVFPTFGFGALIILAIASFWKFNIPTAIIGTLLGNPLLTPVWITSSCLLTGISPKDIKLPEGTLSTVLSHYSQIGMKYLLGNFSISVLVAIVSYFVILVIFKKLKHRKCDEKKTEEQSAERQLS